MEKPMKPLLTPMPFKQHGIVSIASLMPSKRQNVSNLVIKMKKIAKSCPKGCHIRVLEKVVNTKYLKCL